MYGYYVVLTFLAFGHCYGNNKVMIVHIRTVLLKWLGWHKKQQLSISETKILFQVESSARDLIPEGDRITLNRIATQKEKKRKKDVCTEISPILHFIFNDCQGLWSLCFGKSEWEGTTWLISRNCIQTTVYMAKCLHIKSWNIHLCNM